MIIDDVVPPELVDEGVLVRVRACSVNRVDLYEVTGTPWVARPMTGLRRPKSRRIGHDFAGTVEAVGIKVAGLRPGDEVFGLAGGSFAELVCVEKGIGRKPATMSFEEAAAVPTAALTALQGLRDHGRLQPGQRALINGGSGAVGTFAVQIAQALGADVTAVCSTANVEQARSLGADQVIDYSRDDFTRGDGRYDVILDVSGKNSWSRYRRVLAPSGRLVMVGAANSGAFLGPLGHIARVRLAAWRGDQEAVFFVAAPDREDLATLHDLVETGSVKSVIEQRYAFDDVAAALRRVGRGHARGKVVLTL